MSYLTEPSYIERQMQRLEKALAEKKIDDKEYDEEMQILIDRANKGRKNSTLAS